MLAIILLTVNPSAQTVERLAKLFAIKSKQNQRAQLCGIWGLGGVRVVRVYVVYDEKFDFCVPCYFIHQCLRWFHISEC